MNLFCRCILPLVLAALGWLTIPAPMPAQVSSGEKIQQVADARSSDDAAALQKKAKEVQARIQANQADRDQLKRAVKLNEIGSAKEVLLRNGFTAADLENAKITLRTGGGKGGEDELEISATCCDPKEITIQRSLDYFTK
jgi:hypothetical protein